MVNYMITNSSIILNYDGKTVSLTKGDNRYASVYEAIKNKELDKIPGLLNVVEQLEQQGIVVTDGKIFTKAGEEIPTALHDRILAFYREGLPFDNLLLFWDNLKKNPSYNSRQQLFTFLEQNGHPLTEDGCFIAYRGVTKEFKDRHTHTFDNSVGAVCAMPRSEVDDNPNRTCSKGLHVAAYEYAHNFASDGYTMEVKVNPKDVVAVPTDYNGQKMRVCRFEVVAICERPRLDETLYERPNRFSGDFDEMEDEDVDDTAYFEEVDAIIAELVQKYNSNDYPAEKLAQYVYYDPKNIEDWDYVLDKVRELVGPFKDKYHTIG